MNATDSVVAELLLTTVPIKNKYYILLLLYIIYYQLSPHIFFFTLPIVKGQLDRGTGMGSTMSVKRAS